MPELITNEIHDKQVSDRLWVPDLKLNDKAVRKLEDSLRTKASPPIKGEITHWKIRWRGIIAVWNFNKTQVYLSQRGKRISPIIKL